MSKFSAVTEAIANAFTTAGRADAQSLSDQVEALAAHLEPLSGLVDDEAYARWMELRAYFVNGFVEIAASVEAAEKRWTRMVESFGLVRPRTVQAAAKAAQRQRSKAAGKTPSKGRAVPALEVAETSPDASLATSARLAACLELLRSMDADHLIKAQAALLQLAEETAGDAVAA